MSGLTELKVVLTLKEAKFISVAISNDLAGAAGIHANRLASASNIITRAILAAEARAEAKAKEPQSGCACDLQEVAKAIGQEAKVQPPCSDFAPLELHPEYCLFCEHAQACHLGTQG